MKINPAKFLPDEPFIDLETMSEGGKFGLLLEGNRIVCPCICDHIDFDVVGVLAHLHYKGMIFLLNRHDAYGSFLFFYEWGIPVDIDKPSILIIESYEFFAEVNRGSGTRLSEEDMIAIYEEFTTLIKRANHIVTADELMRTSEHPQVKDFVARCNKVPSE